MQVVRVRLASPGVRGLGVAIAAALLAGAASGAGFEILTPGLHHAAELPDSAAGPWWELCLEGEGSSSLRRTELVLVPVVDPTLDGPGAKTGQDVRPGGCAAPLLLLRVDTARSGIALAEGPVLGGFVAEPGEDESWWERPARSIETTFLERPLVVHGRRQGPGYALELGFDGHSQRLFATPWADEASWRSWSVRWAGDLDRDGQPDLLVEASDQERLLVTRLFLSSAARGTPGELVREVARSTTSGSWAIAAPSD